MLTRQRMLICGDNKTTSENLGYQLALEGYLTDIVLSEPDFRHSLQQEHYDAITICTQSDAHTDELLDDIEHFSLDKDVPVFMMAAQDLQQSAPFEPGKLPVHSAHKPMILHVEDNPAMSDIVATTLHDEADVINAPTLEQARYYLTQLDFDLVILDLTLPDGTGLDLLHTLQELDLPVVVHSTWEITETVGNVKAVLNKSLSRTIDLLHTVEDILH